jgi:hypothetical protein
MDTAGITNQTSARDAAYVVDADFAGVAGDDIPGHYAAFS